MKLSNLIEKIEYEVLRGNGDKEVDNLEYDSRKVSRGSVFVCIVGANSDGHAYINDVISKGAAAIIIQRDHKDNLPDTRDAAVICVENTRKALAYMSAAYFGYPAEHIPVIGVTGTKGKTTSTYMIKSILDNSGIPCGIIGTIESDDGREKIPADNTTPESFVIHERLASMIKNGCKACVMEVSSQALMLDRTAGLEFEIGVFTNISPDHIGGDEHKDFADYLHCKSLLFKQCRHGIFNVDDEHINEILEGHTCDVETFGIENKADFNAKNIDHIYRPGYLGISYDLTGKMNFHVDLDVPGTFSVYNSLASIAVCSHFGVDEGTVKEALIKARVKGRIEIVDTDGDYTLLIDYAHNAMALESLLTTLKDYNPKRIVCLFGCGGNRDKARRFEMGEVSGRLADFTIITSDNPRFEEPQAIIEDIKTGIGKTEGRYIDICDRREAIKYAIENAKSGDVIILAGKGHEDYQIIEDKKYPMDERIIIKEIFEEKNK